MRDHSLLVPHVSVRCVRTVDDAVARHLDAHLNGSAERTPCDNAACDACFPVEQCIMGAPRISVPALLADASQYVLLASTAHAPVAGVVIVQYARRHSYLRSRLAAHDRDALCIHTLCTLAPARRQGVAAELLRTVERAAAPHAVYLTVLRPQSDATLAAPSARRAAAALVDRHASLVRYYGQRGYAAVDCAPGPFTVMRRAHRS